MLQQTYQGENLALCGISFVKPVIVEFASGRHTSIQAGGGAFYLFGWLIECSVDGTTV